MMNFKSKKNYAELQKKIQLIDKEINLDGLNHDNIDCLIKQIIDSQRRTHYIDIISERSISKKRCDPTSDFFDPIKAAIHYKIVGNIDESLWLVYLATYFGKNKDTGWSLLQEFYRFQENRILSFETIKEDQESFEAWYRENWERIRNPNRKINKYGNHRKYTTLDPKKNNNPISSIKDFLQKIKNNPNDFIMEIKTKSKKENKTEFEICYEKSDFKSFARMSKFDFSAMLCKIGIISKSINRAYINKATGPLSGIKKLLGNDKLSPKKCDELFNQINKLIDLGPYSAQILEDAICNWQKSPSRYKKFNL